MQRCSACAATALAALLAGALAGCGQRGPLTLPSPATPAPPPAASPATSAPAASAPGAPVTR